MGRIPHKTTDFLSRRCNREFKESQLWTFRARWICCIRLPFHDVLLLRNMVLLQISCRFLKADEMYMEEIRGKQQTQELAQLLLYMTCNTTEMLASLFGGYYGKTLTVLTPC